LGDSKGKLKGFLKEKRGNTRKKRPFESLIEISSELVRKLKAL